MANRVARALHRYASRFIYQRLVPYRNDSGVKFRRAREVIHPSMLQRQKGDASRAGTLSLCLAGLSNLFNPALQDFVGGRFNVNELDTHPDARLENANDRQSLDVLPLAGQFDTYARANRKRLAGAYETATQGNVRGTPSTWAPDSISINSTSAAKGNRIAYRRSRTPTLFGWFLMVRSSIEITLFKVVTLRVTPAAGTQMAVTRMPGSEMHSTPYRYFPLKHTSQNTGF